MDGLLQACALRENLCDIQNMSAQSHSVVPRSLEDLAQPHIESFDYFIGEGLKNLVENMRPVEVRASLHIRMLPDGLVCSPQIHCSSSLRRLLIQ